MLRANEARLRAATTAATDAVLELAPGRRIDEQLVGIRTKTDALCLLRVGHFCQFCELRFSFLLHVALVFDATKKTFEKARFRFCD